MDKYECLIQNLQTNWIFYVTMICCLLMVSSSATNFASALYTFVGASMFGYFTHYVAHNYKFRENYQSSNSMLKDSPCWNWIAETMCDIFDYHDTYHHDSKVNGEFEHLLSEFGNNFFIQGIFPAFYAKLLSYVDIRIILLWGAFYATFHILNYSFVNPKTHSDHHLNARSNYGIDIYDIICGTKHDWSDIEDYNHYSSHVALGRKRLNLGC